MVVAINDLEEGYPYGPEVRFEVYISDRAAYQKAADFLNDEGVDVVCLQHEFGVFGGPAGSNILALLQRVQAPIVTTFHTVLRNPDQQQEQVMRELIRLSSRLVVMTRHTRQLLIDRYSAPPEKVDLIAHGIPDTAWLEPDSCKRPLGVEGKKVLLTFGLLSPGKGIEFVLRALPQIVARFPDVVYIILGATHPALVREQGETYRLSLEAMAEELGVLPHVIFDNRFVELDELTKFIAGSDIYVTPYLNEAQAVSGTLAYAFGCGKAVVSTPYWHAQELLEQGQGILVPFADSNSIAEAVQGLLEDPARCRSMARRAYELGREMLWSRNAHHYATSFEKARRDLRIPQPVPTLRLDHLDRMTDSTGVFQHALFAMPNPDHGYCTDDNARALILTVLLGEMGWQQPLVQRLRGTYLAFLARAFDSEKGRFRNVLRFDRHWQEDGTSEDCQGRALWALGVCLGGNLPNSEQSLAGQLFAKALPQLQGLTSPRATAFALLGIAHYQTRFKGDRQLTRLQENLVGRLYALFQHGIRQDWKWCEEFLSYDNARLAQALICTGTSLSRPELVAMGLRALDWLMNLQTSQTRHLRPIGADRVYHGGYARPVFDQQPVDAWASLSACLEAYRATSDSLWLGRAEKCFEWFLGRNDLGLPTYDSVTGGCHDGIHKDRLNENQGAESTLSFLMSLGEISLCRDAQPPDVSELVPTPTVSPCLLSSTSFK